MSKKAAAARRHWLVKSEPDTYSWKDFVREGETAWTGVRNHSARINLAAMQVGDEVFFYESMTTKAVVGTATVIATATPDPTADEPGWVAVRLKAGLGFSVRLCISWPLASTWHPPWWLRSSVPC
jgi:hypothetical protein